MSKQRRQFEPTAVELIEEAVHLLRRTPPSAFAFYLVGAAPFVLGVLFFWAYTTWFFPASEDVALMAGVLVILFIFMKTAQAGFCRRLMALRLGSRPEVWGVNDWLQVAAQQLGLQVWALLLVVVSIPLTLPFGWVFAYGQTVSVLGRGERLHPDAVAQALLWPAQNHLALLLLSGIGCVVWLNVATAFVLVPALANTLFGIETFASLSGWGMLNTTFLACVTALAWLMVDPLIKAFYTLRVFHGRARRTGDDIRVALKLPEPRSAGLRLATLILFGGLLVSDGRGAEGHPSGESVSRIQLAEFDASIDEVLAGSDFQWRLRALPETGRAATEGLFTRFVRRSWELVLRAVKAVNRVLDDLFDWLRRLFGRDRSDGESDSGGGVALLKAALYLFVAAATGLILWVCLLLVRGVRKRTDAQLGATVLASTVPDLRDDRVQAAQLPADGWLALAREQIGRGEWRLALRAVYLATLAKLASEGHVSLAAFKTNLDYERELRRRAVARPELAERFSRRRREFEDVWYGHGFAAEEPVRAWLAELEQTTTSR